LKPEITVQNLSVHTPFAIAGGTMESASCAILELSDDEGNKGLGEAAPFAAVTGERIGQTADAIRELCASLDTCNPEQGVARLALAARDRKIPRSALCAVECAVLDLIACRRKIPLWRLFGTPRTSNHHLPPIKTDITVPVMGPEKIPDFLEKFSIHQFDTFKVKVSGAVDQDLAAVRAVATWSQKNRPSFRIVLDGNQGFNLKSASQLLAGLGRVNIKPMCFEQPLPRDDLRGLASLSSSTDVPVLLDESVTTVSDVMAAHAARAGSMINIKITKSGVLESLRMIATARSVGLGLMIGGMLETEIAMGFSLHMAAGLGGFDLIDLDTPFFIDRRLTVKSPWHVPSALLPVSNDPGSGATLRDHSPA
jgi:L-alanine-DL-glutamate epimerase-like enolase superfamily enzyme